MGVKPGGSLQCGRGYFGAGHKHRAEDAGSDAITLLDEGSSRRSLHSFSTPATVQGAVDAELLGACRSQAVNSSTHLQDLCGLLLRPYTTHTKPRTSRYPWWLPAHQQEHCSSDASLAAATHHPIHLNDALQQLPEKVHQGNEPGRLAACCTLGRRVGSCDCGAAMHGRGSRSTEKQLAFELAVFLPSRMSAATVSS